MLRRACCIPCSGKHHLFGAWCSLHLRHIFPEAGNSGLIVHAERPIRMHSAWAAPLPPRPAAVCPGAAIPLPPAAAAMASRLGRHALLWVRPRWMASVPGCGRLAQRESASFTPRRSLVRSQYRPLCVAGPLPAGCHQVAGFAGPGGGGSPGCLGGIWELSFPGSSCGDGPAGVGRRGVAGDHGRSLSPVQAVCLRRCTPDAGYP